MTNSNQYPDPNAHTPGNAPNPQQYTPNPQAVQQMQQMRAQAGARPPQGMNPAQYRPAPGQQMQRPMQQRGQPLPRQANPQNIAGLGRAAVPQNRAPQQRPFNRFGINANAAHTPGTQLQTRGPNPHPQGGENLRRSVIETQIEIEKSLIENQKHYLEGVNTVKDLIAPSAVKINSNRLEIGTKFVRTHFVLTYPRVISTGWLEAVINADIPLDLSIFIYPQDSEVVLNELRKKVGKIQASLQINTEKNAARDPALETAYQDVEQLRDAIMQGTEKFYRVGVYVTVYADTEEQLERYSKTIENFFARQNIIAKRAALQMDNGFNSTLPILKDELNVFTNLNTGPLSASFPFVSSDLSSDNGILYGINRHNTSLVIFDRFELENANATIFATSGAGKSYTVKLEILRSLMMGTSVIVIDPENEYKRLSDTVGGTFINLSLNSDNRINPFDLPKPLPGENNADVLRSAIIDLLGLLSLMVGTLNPEENSIMERAIKETYAKYDITENADFSDKVIPTLTPAAHLPDR